MATQIGATHNFSSKDELTSPDLKTCPQCQTVAVPRGINTTRKLNAALPTTGLVNGRLAATCPYCGHIYGRNTLLKRKVRAITVSGAAGATTITVNGATLQMSAAILPTYADNQSVAWSVVPGTGLATINAAGLLTPGVPIANPVAAPSLTTATTGGSLPAATYYVRFTWKNALGETMVSPEANIVTTGATSTITVTVPALPAGATSAEMYIGTAAGVGTRQGTTGTTSYTQTAALIAGTAAPASNNAYNRAGSNGTVTTKATANDGSGAVGLAVITLSNQA